MQKRRFIVFIIMLIIVGTITIAHAEGEEDTYQRAVVVHATEQMNHPNEEFESVQYVTLKITSGKYKGQMFESKNILSGKFIFDFPVEAGDKVVVFIDESHDAIEIHIADYRRDHYIFGLMILFILLLLIVGRKKGLKTICTLSLTIILIYKFMIPMLLKGYSPALLAICISIIITIVTLLAIGGLSIKSYSAIIGTIIGVLVAGLLAYTIGSLVRLTGLSSEEAIMLTYIAEDIALDFKELLFAGILLGALGAVMDVSISIASSIEEVYKANPRVSVTDLFKSGMNVGSDIMGTMANTLILAYTGSSIPILMLFMANNTQLTKIINFDMIATEVVRSLAGSIGLILTIPSTALVSCVMIKIFIKDKPVVIEED